MRTLAVSLILASAALLAGPALAQNEDIEAYTITVGNPYDYNTATPVVRSAPVRPRQQRFYENAFFTPEANWQQAGYTCTGLVSVYRQRGVKHLHRGSYCVR